MHGQFKRNFAVRMFHAKKDKKDKLSHPVNSNKNVGLPCVSA